SGECRIGSADRKLDACRVPCRGIESVERRECRRAALAPVQAWARSVRRLPCLDRSPVRNRPTPTGSRSTSPWQRRWGWVYLTARDSSTSASSCAAASKVRCRKPSAPKAEGARRRLEFLARAAFGGYPEIRSSVLSSGVATSPAPYAGRVEQPAH